jgi:hypothetical protein
VADRRPKQSVQGVQCRARPLAFEHGNLLSKRQDFKGRVASALAEDADHREQGEDEFGHEFSLVTRRNVDLPTLIVRDLKLLIPQHHRVLSTHRGDLAENVSKLRLTKAVYSTCGNPYWECPHSSRNSLRAARPLLIGNGSRPRAAAARIAAKYYPVSTSRSRHSQHTSRCPSR